MEYEAPDWSCLPVQKFKIDIIKNGLLLSEELLPTDREFLSVGRLPTCDISMEHASVSRHHAILQFGQGGIFIYDLGSTHGTFLNKQRITAKTYIRLPSDSILRFGESSRIYVITPLAEEIEPKCPWKEEPLKFLRRFLKNQEEELDIAVEPDEAGGFITKITLDSAVFTASSEILSASGTGRSKKEASDRAAEDICQQVQRLGGFVKEEKLSLSLGRRRSLSPEEGDSYFDRTAKRPTREAKAGIETVETLYAKQTSLKSLIAAIMKQIAETEKILSPIDGDAEIDELDAVMNELNSKQAAKDEKQLGLQLAGLQSELNDLEAVLKVVDPKGEFFQSEEQTSGQAEEHSEDIIEAHMKEHTEEKKESYTDMHTEAHTEELVEQRADDDTEEVEWVPPEETESERTRLLKEQYGY